MSNHHSLDVCGITDVGKVRQQNEDQFFVASLQKSMQLHATSLEDTSRFDQKTQEDAFLLVVADGVGSVGGGKIASSMAVETVGELIAQTTTSFYTFDVREEHEFLERLEDAVRRTHELIREQFGGKGRGPATTLTMAAVIWPRAYIVHIGDSRCYYLHQGRLLQVTRDQTMGAMMVDEGVMTEEQVKRGSLDNVLASAIGGEIDPFIGLVDLDETDTLLLCTDGLTKHVSDEEIAAALSEEGPAGAPCKKLVDIALADGGSDNVTAIVARRAGTR